MSYEYSLPRDMTRGHPHHHHATNQTGNGHAPPDGNSLSYEAAPQTTLEPVFVPENTREPHGAREFWNAQAHGADDSAGTEKGEGARGFLNKECRCIGCFCSVKE